MLYRAFVLPIQPQDAVPEPVEAESGYSPVLSIDSERAVGELRGVQAGCPQLLPRRAVDGVFDSHTRDAVMAFEKIEKG